MQMTVIEADITTLDVDAIVNAANSDLRRGGGVCGAIFRAAGPGLEEACRALAPCPTGEARLTPGFGLTARWIIHAVGPVWKGGDRGEAAALADCYRTSLALAAEQGCASIAFPAISTGIYGFPPERAAPIAVRAAQAAAAPLHQIIFCCFGADSARLHRQALEAL
ncbi:MAG: O-acetyl-ADP-ribose deacetylase [Neomegalonema sp.]|nr:O-acetyl-ADP-ribose deacetylase [Neomegalonema sp.]